MGVIRIIVESAMLYTVETAIIIILFVLNHPAGVIVQGALCPTTGEFQTPSRLPLPSVVGLSISMGVRRRGRDERHDLN